MLKWIWCDFVERIESSHHHYMLLDACGSYTILPTHTHTAHSLKTIYWSHLTKQKKKKEKTRARTSFEKSARNFRKKICKRNAKNAFNWIKWKKIPQSIALDNDFVFCWACILLLLLLVLFFSVAFHVCEIPLC